MTSAIILSISVLTFNLRISTANDADNSWHARQDAVIAAIDDLQPDILSVQEASLEQDSFLVARLTDYTRLPLLDTIRHSTQIVNGIFVRRDRFRVCSANLFWLSPSPLQPSVGWGAAYPRVANHVILHDQTTHAHLMMVNTHLDHVSSDARAAELRMIADTIRAYAHDALPVFLTGDFNVPPTDTVLSAIRSLMTSTAEAMHNPTLTFHDWGRRTSDGEQIDYIFFLNAYPLSYRVIQHGYGVTFLSDHYPVLGVFDIPHVNQQSF